MKTKYILLALALLSLLACRNEEYISEEQDNNDEQSYDSTAIDLSSYPDWSTETHSNSVDADFETVFPQNTVMRFDITISSSNYSALYSNLNSQMSSQNSPPGMASDADYELLWVPCTITFNETDWYQVGIRFKGNSSLQSAYESGNGKLSFKLDFDQFEDDYPALKNQRFYGFKQLNLNNNYNDASLMREKVGADLFRQFGLAAANTSFCVVYVDYGSGPQYFGVYTLVEEVDNTVIKNQFTDGSGNLYKPDGDPASFALGSFDTDGMELKTNKDSADYSDVKSLYDALHSATRSSDTEAWKAGLESVLDVDKFLKWLAANIVIQNWDTYGRMTHNYYLYNNPETSLLTWIPWDNNEAFEYGKMSGALGMDLQTVGSSWPLISYLMDIPEYEATYETYMKQFIDEVFVPEDMIATYESYYNLLKEYAYEERSGYTYINSDTYFDSAVSTLKTHVQNRNDAVNSYVN